MKIESLHLGMKVRHPQYGIGQVKSLKADTAEVEFNDGVRPVSPELSGLEPAEPQAALTGLQVPLRQLLAETAQALVCEMGLEPPDAVVEQLAARWHKGRVVLHSADANLQPKEVPLEAFFHKIVMVRNNLRCLEQKINSHPQFSDAEKVELQQYITRSYGSLTTFNLLFKNKPDQFVGTSAG